MHTPNKINPTAYGIIQYLNRGKSIKSLPGVAEGERAADVHLFFSNLKAAYDGSLSNPDEALAVEREQYSFDFTRLPILGEIAVTYRCNNVCRFCYASCDSGRQIQAELSTGKIKRIIKIFKNEAKLPFFSFTGGEPLLRSDLESLIRFAEKHGLRTNLITNGMLATPRRAESLSASGLKTAQVSLESSDESVHDNLTGVPGSWRQTIDGIKNLMRCGLSVQTNTTLTAKNAHSAAELPAFLAELGISRFAMNLFIPVGRGLYNQELFLPYSKAGTYIEAARAAARGCGLIFYWYSPLPHCHYNPIAKGLGNKSCAAMDGLLSISPTGDVLPCSSYSESLGNILTERFSEIWFSERAMFFKKKRYAPSECKGCESFVACQAACPLYWEYAGCDEIVGCRHKSLEGQRCR